MHVGVADYDHTVENHARLLSAFKEHEDTLYRLAQNPERRAHRGTQWCSPNMAPSGPYANTSGFAAEFRTIWGNFPGPDYYQVCATNPNSTNTLVNIRILVDGEF